jgi:hypothetical protein
MTKNTDSTWVIPEAIFRSLAPTGEVIESGCIVLTVPDSDGNFLAIDSEGVECQYSLYMKLEELK